MEDLEKKREQTQAALARKLGLLEERLFGTVEEARNTLKRTVDLEYQLKNHPVVTLSLSALLGYLVGRQWFAHGEKSGSAAADKVDRRSARGRNSAELWDEASTLLQGIASVVISNLVMDWVKDLRPQRPSKTNRTDPKS